MNGVSITRLASCLFMLRKGAEQFIFYAQKQRDGAWYLSHDADILLLEDQAQAESKRAKSNVGPVLMRAPMPGLVLAVQARVGRRVQKGDTLMVLEAMKMQNPIKACAGGKISRLAVKPGMSVEAGALLAEIASA